MVLGVRSVFTENNVTVNRSQWSRGLRRRSVADRLVGLWPRIPREYACLSVVILCHQVEISETCRSLVQRSP
jgi:hypothetical protein